MRGNRLGSLSSGRYAPLLSLPGIGLLEVSPSGVGDVNAPLGTAGMNPAYSQWALNS